MEKRIFGATDGIRSEVGQSPLRPNCMRNLGRAIANYFKRGTILMGRDTRESGFWMANELKAGFDECGVTVEDLDTLPTPAVQKFVGERDDIMGGVMLTASHNPATDNGVKVFGTDGDKLTDGQELEVERLYFEDELDRDRELPEVDYKIVTLEETIDGYAHLVEGELGLGDSLSGQKIILDAASGAGHEFSREVFEQFGLGVEQIDPEPTGKNINDGYGALYPEKMAARAGELGVVGVALDGDADRVIIADENGRLWDGDRLNILIAEYLIKQGRLKARTVVVSEYSNQAMVKYLNGKGVKVEKVVNGDRAVALRCKELKVELGSEFSGHILYMPWLNASDGTFTTLLVKKIALENGGRLADLWADFEYMPSKQWGIKVREKRPLEEIDGFQEAVKRAEADFAGNGRVFCRYSGTENKLRILVEAEDAQLVEKHGEKLAAIIKKEIGDDCDWPSNGI